jgi:hypothetical protein
MKRLNVRHWIFLGLFVVVVGAMLVQGGSDVQVSPETQKMYDYIDSLPRGSILLISFDHEASSLPEIRPLALALLRHAFKRGHHLIGIALLAEGTGIGYRLMSQAASEYGRRYGTDWVYLGFKPQYIAAILSMGESFSKTFPEDYLGTAYVSLPLLRDTDSYNDVSGVISVADGSMVVHWVEYGAARYSVRVSAFVTAAMVTTYDPYVATGQIHAMVGGLRGAAEYEKLLGYKGSGLRSMLAQTSAHVYIILLIIIGNVIYFIGRRKGRSR